MAKAELWVDLNRRFSHFNKLTIRSHKVMIVNVNPYDTGFDENSHVMRFSALARDVATTTTRVPPRVPPTTKSSGMGMSGRAASVVPAKPDRMSAGSSDGRPSLGPVRTARKVRLSEGTPAEAVLEVVEGMPKCCVRLAVAKNE